MELKELKSADNLKLNLGCGDKIMKGFVNLDILYKEGVVYLNLNKYPWPFKDNSVSYAISSHVLEHLDDPVKFMLELHRVCKKGAIIDLYLPHYSLCANYADLTHKRQGFSYLTFGYSAWNKEINKKFRTLKTKLDFTRINYRFLNYFFNPLINLFPIVYERFFSYMLPCAQIHFRLKAVK